MVKCGERSERICPYTKNIEKRSKSSLLISKCRKTWTKKEVYTNNCYNCWEGRPAEPCGENRWRLAIHTKLTGGNRERFAADSQEIHTRLTGCSRMRRLCELIIVNGEFRIWTLVVSILDFHFWLPFLFSLSLSRMHTDSWKLYSGIFAVPWFSGSELLSNNL